MKLLLFDVHFLNIFKINFINLILNIQKIFKIHN